MHSAKLILTPPRGRALFKGSDLLNVIRARSKKPRFRWIAVRCRVTVKPFWFDRVYLALPWPTSQQPDALAIQADDGTFKFVDARDFEPCSDKAEDRRHFPQLRAAPLPANAKAVDDFGWEIPVAEAEARGMARRVH